MSLNITFLSLFLGVARTVLFYTTVTEKEHTNPQDLLEELQKLVPYERLRKTIRTRDKVMAKKNLTLLEKYIFMDKKYFYG